MVKSFSQKRVVRKKYEISERAEDAPSPHAFISIWKFLTKTEFSLSDEKPLIILMEIIYHECFDKELIYVERNIFS